MNRLKTAALVAVAASALAACSTVSTGSSELALQYGGGSWDSANFVACFGGGVKDTTRSPSDSYKYYPTGQRDLSFGDDRSLDSAALTSTTKDAQEIKVTGTVKFTMNLSCTPFKDPTGKSWPGGTAQYFHEIYGDKDHAYNDEGSKPVGEGWSKMLRQYMGFAVDREVDDNALNFTLADLNTDRAKKDSWEDEVRKGLPATLKSMTGGVEVFRINDVLLQRPGVRPEIADANAEKQAAQIRADAVEVDKTAAANFPGGIAGYQAYQQQQAVNEAIKSGKVKVIPIPQGSPVIVSGN